MVDPMIHPTAEVPPDVLIGNGTKIWHYVQLRPGVRIGEECILGRDVYLDERIVVGNRVKIQNRVSVYLECTIEDGVFIGPHVVFTNDQFPRAINPDGSLKEAADWHAGTTIVCEGASIGANSTILPSKRIGRYALIGAGSVVTKDVPDHAIVVGNPARQVGFACMCAGRLHAQSEDDYACGACGRLYHIADGHVFLLNQDLKEIR